MNPLVQMAAGLDPAVLFEEATGCTPDVWQAGVLRSEAPRLLLNCARQLGKSSVTAVLALHVALFQPRSLVLLLSPSLRQSGELYRKLAGAYRALGRPVEAENETASTLTLVNGSRVLSLPGKEGTIRGYSGVDLLVIDEAARVPDDLYFACRPMLAVSGGRLICLSTPFGKRGWFHKEWSEGQGWERVKVTAAECPRISKEFLEEERRTHPERWFASEYECEFVEPDGAVFSGEDIAAIFAAGAGLEAW